MLNRITTDAQFVAAFPGMQKFVRTVVVSKSRGCCGGRGKKVKVAKKRVVNHNELKKHIAGLPPTRQEELKRLLGVRNLNIKIRRPDRKIVQTTI
jgi:hypothetical protein